MNCETCGGEREAGFGCAPCLQDKLSAALLQVEQLKDKYETCEQCDGSTDAGVFCVPCWNRVNLQIRELQEDKEQLVQQRDRAHAAADSQEKDLEAANRLNDAMKELLSQYQSNVHLFKHDAKVAPMDCPIEPCPKTTKAILGTTEKRNNETKG